MIISRIAIKIRTVNSDDNEKEWRLERDDITGQTKLKQIDNCSLL
jgi:hypothetical protein